jgi:hypothetical protein
MQSSLCPAAAGVALAAIAGACSDAIPLGGTAADAAALNVTDATDACWSPYASPSCSMAPAPTSIPDAIAPDAKAPDAMAVMATDGGAADGNATLSPDCKTCPPPSDAAAPQTLEMTLDCYCMMQGTCAADGGSPHYLCIDGDAVEETYAACNLLRIRYTNGGGLEHVELYYDALGAWVGLSDYTDGPDFCGRNIAVAGTHAVPTGCALTDQQALCPSEGGPPGDGGDAGTHD